MGGGNGTSSEQDRSLAVFEEMLEFLVFRLSQASDVLAPPEEEGALASAVNEFSALMNSLAEDLAAESRAHRRYLLRTGLPALLKALLGRTYAEEPEAIELAVREALNAVGRALAKVLPGTDGEELEGASESLVLLFDRRQDFYRHTAAPGGTVAAAMEGTQLLSVMSEEDWRAGVGFADWVDAVCADGQIDVRRWRRAQIIEESSTGRLRLSFEGLSDYYDEWISRDSADIAPPGTRSGYQVEQWRRSLQRGSLVDALDPNNTWTNATVLDTRSLEGNAPMAPMVIGVGSVGDDFEERKDGELELLIGYRVYDPEGDREEPIPEGAGDQSRDEATLALEEFTTSVPSRAGIDLMVTGAACDLNANPCEEPSAVFPNAENATELDAANSVVTRAKGLSASITAPAAGGWGPFGRTRSQATDGGSSALSSAADESVRTRRFFGLASRDEWIAASSTRIEKLNSRAPLKNSWAEEAPVNDSDDPSVNEDGQRLFAVFRTPVEGAPALVGTINTFGRAGGFENLVERLSPSRHLPPPLADALPPPVPNSSEVVADPPPAPVREAPLSVKPSSGAVAEGDGQRGVADNHDVGVDAARNTVVAVSSIRPLLARVVAREIIDRIATSAAAALQRTSGSELRGLTRERMDGIVNAYRELLKRGRRSSEAFRLVQRLQLNLALKLFRCPFMERKLQGLKVIADAAAASGVPTVSALPTRSPGIHCALTPKELVQWLESENFIKDLFSSHTQLIRRSGEILAFLSREKALSAAHFDMMWAAGGSGQDKDRRICVHELDMDLLEVLVDKLSAQPHEEAIEDTVAFIRDIAEATQQGSSAPALRLVDLLWAMADEKNSYRQRIRSGAAECIMFVTGLRGLREHRATMLERCVKNVHENRVVVTSLKVMEAVLNQFSKEGSNYDPFTRSHVIYDLEDHHGLTELLLRELESYVCSSRSTARSDIKARSSSSVVASNDAGGSNSVGSEATSDRLPSDRDWRSARGTSRGESHLKQVEVRLQTMEYLCDNSQLVLGTEQIKRLWASLGPGPATLSGGEALQEETPEMVTGQATRGEVSTLLSWLSKACEACDANASDGAKGEGMFEPHVAAELFQELMVSDGEDIAFARHRASPEWFSCFQTFFFMVNRHAGRICVDTIDSTEAGAAAGSLEAEAISLSPTAAKATEWENDGDQKKPGEDGDGGPMGARTEDPPPLTIARSSRDPDAPLNMVVVPSALAGMRALWNVALEAESVSVVKQATRLLNRTHQELAPYLRKSIGRIREEYISTCMAYIEDEKKSDEDESSDEAGPVGGGQQVPLATTPTTSPPAADRQRSLVRALRLLEEMVDETEMGGTRGLVGHGARVRGCPVTLSFDNKVSHPTSMPSTFKLEVHTNVEVWEVRRRLASMANAGIAPENIELELFSQPDSGSSIHGNTGRQRRSVETLDRDNSRRLRDLGLRPDDVWVVTRRQGPAVPLAPLLTPSGELVPRAAHIFEKWFYDHANADGKMDRLGAANFIDSCCHDRCKPTDDRVTKFFSKYDADGDGLLTIKDFLRLFQCSCKDMPQVVRNNLKAHHYREDLSRATDSYPNAANAQQFADDPASQQEQSLPRCIISRHRRSVDRLVSVLDLGGPAAAAAWRFLMRLPTNPEMLDAVQKLEVSHGPSVADGAGDEARGRWDELLGPPGSFRMLYTLQIIDGILDATETGHRLAGGGQADADCAKWVVNFVRSGGFAHFSEAILTKGLFGDCRSDSMVPAQQACLALVLKVVRIILVGVLSITPGMQTHGRAAEKSGDDLDVPSEVAPADSEAARAAPTLSPPPTLPTSLGHDVDDQPRLWASLPQDVVEAVCGAVNLPKWQIRLMELAGVAAEIANACAAEGAGLQMGGDVMSWRSVAGGANDVNDGSYIDLRGCVSKGAPVEMVAEEALSVWVAVSCSSEGLWAQEGDREALSFWSEESLAEPVLRGIVCASDAIRRKLEHSLIAVSCSGGGGELGSSKGFEEPGTGPKDLERLPLEGLEDKSEQMEARENVGEDGTLQSRATDGSGATTTPRDQPSRRRADDIRHIIIGLLLDSIPDAAKQEDIEGWWPCSSDGGQEYVEGPTSPSVLAARPSRRVDYTQLFGVLCALVKASIKAQDGAAGERICAHELDVENLASIVGKRLLEHPCTEKRGAKEADKDTLLVGLLELAVTVMKIRPDARRSLGGDFVEALVDQILLAPATPASTWSEALAPTRPNCKTAASRAVAFELLATLCKPATHAEDGSAPDGNDSDVAVNLRLLLDKGLRPLGRFLTKPDVWGYSPSSGERSTVGRVGLRNLGNTCYINSCLQQLFMMAPIRDGLLSLSEGDTPPGSLVRELQKLFGHLALSEKQVRQLMLLRPPLPKGRHFPLRVDEFDAAQTDSLIRCTLSAAVDPSPFLGTMKDLDGNPIDVSVQQDAQGFLLDLFDKMEAGLKGTEQSSLMSTFEGTQITQLICPRATSPAPIGASADAVSRADVGTDESNLAAGVGSREFDTRERGEAFMCLSLEVKNMMGVEDALEKFIEKEVISGYRWDEQRRDVSIHRRTVLGKLPPNVVLHLNRFKMNLDTFQTEKINSRFEFPSLLNLEPFTKEGLAWRERVEAAGGRDAEDAKRLGLPGPYELHPREFYMYKLRGIVVHTGTANQGHYFSYVRHPRRKRHNPAGDSCNGSSSNATSCPRSSPTPTPVQAVGSPSTISLSADDSAASATGEEARDATDHSSILLAQEPDEAVAVDRESAACEGSAVDRARVLQATHAKFEEGAWCEFNDTVVKEWDFHGSTQTDLRESDKEGVHQDGRPTRLEADCFGGQQNTQETDEFGWPLALTKDNIQNAYLLFYERVDQTLQVGLKYAKGTAPESGSTPACWSLTHTESAVECDGIGQSESNGSPSISGQSVSAQATTEQGLDPSVLRARPTGEADPGAEMASVVPPGVFKAVWDDNNKFLLDRQLYHRHMSQFILEILKAVQHVATGKDEKERLASRSNKLGVGAPPECEALVQDYLDWGTKYALDNLARAQDNELFPLVVKELQGLYDLCPRRAGAFLDEETDRGMKGMRDMLLLCPDRSVREALCGFYLHLLCLLAEAEGDSYLEYEPPRPGQPLPGTAEHEGSLVEPSLARLASVVSRDEESDKSSWLAPAAGVIFDDIAADDRRGRPRTRLGRLVEGWLSLLPDAARSWGRFEQFLQLMEGIADMGDRERDLLLHRGMVSRLSSFYLQDKSPLYDPKNRLARMGHKTVPPCFSPLVRCLRTLRAHSGESARWQPTTSPHTESETDTAYETDGSHSQDSISSTTAVASMQVGVANTSRQDSRELGQESSSDTSASVAAGARTDPGGTKGAGACLAGDDTSSTTSSLGSGADAEIEILPRPEVDAASGRVKRTKDRATIVALSPNCRRCLNCEALYDLAFEDQHAPEAAAELMCSWAADSSKLLRPLSRMIVQGVDTTAFLDVDSWLLALRKWLEIRDTLQTQRLEVTLGTGMQQSEAGLLFRVMTQRDKYDKWLLRVLTVLSELLVENPVVAGYVSKLRNDEMLPWTDWITKHLNGNYGSARGATPSRVKHGDLVQLMENLRSYERGHFGRTAEDRLADMVRRATLGPAEGELWLTRAESHTTQGVQVEILDVTDVMPGGVQSAIAAGPTESEWNRLWRVTNHRMDSVKFTFKIFPATSRLDTVYPLHDPAPLRELKIYLKPRDTQIIRQVDEFRPWAYRWWVESARTEMTIPEEDASDLLQQQAQLEGDLGEAARVALAAEEQEAAEADKAAAAIARRADEEEIAQAVAAAADSLPSIPLEVVSKMKADSTSEGKFADGSGAAEEERLYSLRQKEEEDQQATFWETGREQSALDVLREKSRSTEECTADGASLEEKTPETADDVTEDGVTLLFDSRDVGNKPEGHVAGGGDDEACVRDTEDHEQPRVCIG